MHVAEAALERAVVGNSPLAISADTISDGNSRFRSISSAAEARAGPSERAHAT
jgi:hypothetical protein